MKKLQRNIQNPSEPSCCHLLENPFQKSPVSALHQKDILSFTVFYRFSFTNSSLRFLIVTAINPSMGESKKDRKKYPTPDRPL
jgi:hypothetical protein